MWAQCSLFCNWQWAWLLLISPDKCSRHLLVNHQHWLKKTVHDQLQAEHEAAGKHERWRWVHFSLPLNADINQKALKTRLTRLIPRRAQEPLCKVRQLGETEHVCIWLKTLLAVLQLHVFTDRCWHVLSGPIISKDKHCQHSHEKRSDCCVSKK